MLKNGSTAVARVQHQLVVVQAARSHDRRDKFVEVNVYSPIGQGIFMALSEAAGASIPASDILAVLDHEVQSSSHDIIELTDEGMTEFLRLAERNQERYEKLWSSWLTKN